MTERRRERQAVVFVHGIGGAGRVWAGQSAAMAKPIPAGEHLTAMWREAERWL